MTTPLSLPAGLVLERTTPEWDQDSVPAGLLRHHRIAEGVWGRLIVREGSLDFTFEDEDVVVTLTAPARQVIPPDRAHHVTITGPVRFCVEFHVAAHPAS